ncbi:MAG: response regulator transcription factor [Lachnospiraceae bacterium]
MKKIAIVEDERLYNAALAEVLKKEGYQVSQCYSVEEGKKAVEECPDIMVIDVCLPDGKGMEVCKKAHDEKEIPVIFLTACDEEENMIKAFDLGADDYLVKPFSMPVFVKHVEAVLRRTQGEKEVLLYRDLKVDFLRRQVTCQEREIKLTAKEYELFTFLAKNRGQVVTKEQILEHLWDSKGNYVEENTLNVTLNRLRKKIEPDPKKPIYIRNVFGLGYTFGE